MNRARERILLAPLHTLSRFLLIGVGHLVALFATTDPVKAALSLRFREGGGESSPLGEEAYQIRSSR